MRRAKLLYVATEDWYFVSDTLPLARAAKARGYDVFVAARENDKRALIAGAGLEFIPLEKISRSGIGAVSETQSVMELTRLYRTLAPDLVHHIALKPILYGALAARDRKALAVVNSVMGLGYVFTSNAAKAIALRPFMGLALRHALARPRSRTIVQNRDDLESVARLSPAARGNLALIRGSGVDPGRFAVKPEPAGVPVIVLPGRLLRDKGLFEFVAAARTLKREGVKARFCLVGEPDADNPASVTREKIAAWVSEGLVEHWGFRADMPAVYAEATLVCLPSYREGLPRVLLEAASTGRAVIATDVPGCREVVVAGVNGWMVPARDKVALCDAIREAIAKPKLRAHYGAAGRALVEKHFTSDIIIGETLGLYERLLHGAPRKA